MIAPQAVEALLAELPPDRGDQVLFARDRGLTTVRSGRLLDGCSDVVAVGADLILGDDERHDRWVAADEAAAPHGGSDEALGDGADPRILVVARDRDTGAVRTLYVHRIDPACEGVVGLDVDHAGGRVLLLLVVDDGFDASLPQVIVIDAQAGTATPFDSEALAGLELDDPRFEADDRSVRCPHPYEAGHVRFTLADDTVHLLEP